MGLFDIKPAREAAKNVHIVADLDKLMAEPVGFRYNGKTHYIKPIKTSEFFKVTQQLANMDALKSKSKIENEEIIDAYSDLIGSVCDTIGPKEVAQMTQPQVAALFQLVLDCITGKVYAVDAQKKKPLATDESLRSIKIFAAIWIGEVCRAFSWSIKDVLNMPATQFFCMLEAARVLDAYDKIDKCDIAAISICHSEWYESTKERFSSIIKSSSIYQGEDLEEGPTNRPALEGDEAKYFMMSIFAAKKRTL